MFWPCESRKWSFGGFTQQELGHAVYSFPDAMQLSAVQNIFMRGQHPKTRPFRGHKQPTFFSRRASQQSCVRPGALPIFNQLRNVSQSCSYHSLPGTLGILEPSGVSSMSQRGCLASNKTQSCLGNFSTTNQHQKAKTCMFFDSFGRARLQFWLESVSLQHMEVRIPLPTCGIQEI